MNERHLRALGSRAWLLVDEPSAAGLQLRERRGDVVNAKGDVVQARPPLLDVPGDRRVGRGRFEQLEARLPDRDEVGAHALRLHILRRINRKAQRIAVERERGIKILDRNADVIEYRSHRVLRGFVVYGRWEPAR